MRKVTIEAILVIAIFTVEPSSSGLGGQDQIANILSQRMNEARSNQPTEQRISKAQWQAADPGRVLVLLSAYQRDSSWAVRHLALVYATQLAEAHPLPWVKQEVTKRLVESAIAHSVSGELRWLERFTAMDFDERSKGLIRQALAKPEDRTGGDVSVWICGLANMQDQLPRLKELTIDEMQYQAEADKIGDKKWYFTTGWAARLACARMGVREDIAKCIQLAESEQDATERVLRILPQIGYVRQPEAIEYLRKYLESSERLPPTNPGMPGELYASRVMHIFAESLEDYPVRQKPAGNYTEEEIDLCRRWMASKANWKIIR